MTELATTKNSASQDKARRAKAGEHDSVGPCCVKAGKTSIVKKDFMS